MLSASLAILKTLASFCVIGALLGALHGHWYFRENTAKQIAKVRAVQLERSDVAARQAQARIVGEIRGWHLAGVVVHALVGAGIAAAIGSAWVAVHWIIGS